MMGRLAFLMLLVVSGLAGVFSGCQLRHRGSRICSPGRKMRRSRRARLPNMLQLSRPHARGRHKFTALGSQLQFLP